MEADSTTDDGISERLNGGLAVDQPVQIIKVNEETREFELDVDSLASVLLCESIRDKPVAVVSIAGDFRKGKSFLLNFFLRYLSRGIYETSEWLGDKDEPLKGFSWRGGSERDTTGILMWSRPFVMKLPDGREIGVILMDTQGAFDSEFTVRDSATVFALSTMTSSVQVFNLLHNLQEDNLQVLEIFTEYGRLALETSDETPFQKLMFLIRDWSFPYEHAYGLTGGLQLLDKKLTVKENQPAQLQRVRRHVRSCFSDIECFLMPHPGPKVATNPKFDGRQSDIDSEFVDSLQLLVPLVLEPGNMVVKKIGGQEVTGRQLMEYFKVYINIFRGETMPEPKSMLEATAEANNLAAVAQAKDHYMTSMEEICGGSKPFVNPKKLEQMHLEVRDAAIQTFNGSRKMGGKEFSEVYLKQLSDEIVQSWDHFEAQNKSKNVFSILGSPVILLLWCVVCYVCSRIFDLVGLLPLANLFWLFGTASLAVTISYMVLRYTGNFPELVQSLDSVSEVVWSFVLDASFKVMQNAVQNRTGLQLNNNATISSSSMPSTPSSPAMVDRSPRFPTASVTKRK